MGSNHRTLQSFYGEIINFEFSEKCPVEVILSRGSLVRAERAAGRHLNEYYAIILVCCLDTCSEHTTTALDSVSDCNSRLSRMVIIFEISRHAFL